MKNNPDVKAFVESYISNAEETVNKVGYLPLTSAIYNFAKSQISDAKTGTRFGGKEAINLKIETLAKMPLVEN